MRRLNTSKNYNKIIIRCYNPFNNNYNKEIKLELRVLDNKLYYIREQIRTLEKTYNILLQERETLNNILTKK